MPVGSLLTMLGVGVASIGTSLVRRRPRLAILREVAKRHRGVLEMGGLLGHPTLEVRFEDGIRLVIRMWPENFAKNTKYDMRLPAPTLPLCNMAPNGHKNWLGRTLGLQDLQTGYPELDRVFVVKGTEEALVRRLWSPPTADAMTRAFPTSRLECRGPYLELLQPAFSSVDEVDLAIELLLALARRDVYGVRVLGELPEATVVRGEHGFMQAELPGPSRIVVGPHRRDEVTRTRAESAVVLTNIPDDARRRTQQLGAVIENTALATTIEWPSIEDDPARLVGAIEILRSLARGTSAGPFR